MTALLELRRLGVTYRSGGVSLPAVRDVSLALALGQAIGLVGESGSGKSTIAGAVLDLLGTGSAVEGEIVFEGRDLRILAASERRRLLGPRIGAVFQDPFTALNPAMTVGRHIAEPLTRTERIVIINSGGDGGGAARLTQDISNIIAQVPETVEALTGMDVIGAIKNLPAVKGAAPETAGEGQGEPAPKE